MIPKIIHYCWFGKNPLPELACRCIESWKKYCPDYEIKEWNEKNVDLTSCDYMREAYEEKQWGFVPDVARLQIVYNHGGIYLDTDVEVLKSFDSLLDNKAFAGLEDGKWVALGLGFGAEKGHPILKQMLALYDGRHFRNTDGTLDRTPNPTLMAPFFETNGLVKEEKMQTICGTIIYPSEYFCPKSFKTGLLTITDNTYSIHHYDGSWCTEEEKERVLIRHNIYQRWGCLSEAVWFFTRVKMKIRRVGLWETVLACFKKLKSL